MRSSKSRSRSKSNRNKPSGNIVNRVFDSSGPEGKVRGTPQQIIDKYSILARDAQLAGDLVAVENFQQHAEHYIRLLAEAQREQEERRQQQEQQQQQAQARRAEKAESRSESSDAEPVAEATDAPEAPASDSPAEDASTLVETPESKPVRSKRTYTRRKRTAEDSGEPKTAAE